jgi:ABC-type spermidine/putrescine transport system permease subunit I
VADPVAVPDAALGRARAWREELGPGSTGLLLTPLLFVLALAFVVPLGWLFWTSLGHYDLVTRGVGRRALENTVETSAVVTVFAVVIGGFLAWELRNARSRLYSGLLWATLLFPLWTSVIVRNYSLTLLLQRNGFVNDALQGLGITNGPVKLLYTDFAVVLGMTHSLIPFAALPLYAAFVLIDDDLLHAARGLGASSRRAFASIVLPLAAPSVVATATLVFVVACGFYVTPTVLGAPSSPFVATVIDQEVNALFDLPGAAAASFLLVAGGLAVVLAAGLFVGWRRMERVLS